MMGLSMFLYPQFKLRAGGQKSKRVENVAMAPDFEDWLMETPVDQ